MHGFTLLAKHPSWRWGGDYRDRKDEQHFEYMGTPATAAAETKKLTGASCLTDHERHLYAKANRGELLTDHERHELVLARRRCS